MHVNYFSVTYSEQLSEWGPKNIRESTYRCVYVKRSSPTFLSKAEVLYDCWMNHSYGHRGLQGGGALWVWLEGRGRRNWNHPFLFCAQSLLRRGGNSIPFFVSSCFSLPTLCLDLQPQEWLREGWGLKEAVGDGWDCGEMVCSGHR